MLLPETLRAAIERETSTIPPADLRRAAERLSERYRRAERAPSLSEPERLAYLATRLPATFAAVSAVLAELIDRCPDLPVRRLLDLGAGPGTVVAAASTMFDNLVHAVLVESDAAFVALGERLVASLVTAPAARVEWRSQSASAAIEMPDATAFDLVVASYVAGEMAAADVQRLIDVAWRATGGALVVIEPGTPAGYACVLAARAQLIGLGAHIAAPCPHAGACPLVAPDWCHFAARLNRSAQHRRLKQGTMAYEDEKYSYVIATREAASPVPARVIDRPVQHKGFVDLRLCTTDGLRMARIPRSKGPDYRAARRARWGDGFYPT